MRTSTVSVKEDRKIDPCETGLDAELSAWPSGSRNADCGHCDWTLSAPEPYTFPHCLETHSWMQAMKNENSQMARLHACNVVVLASRLPARPRHSSSPVHSQSPIIFKPSNAQMKQKYNKAKDGLKGFFRPRSRQSESAIEAASVYDKLRSAMKDKVNLFEPLQIALVDLVNLGHSKVSSLDLK